MSRYAQRTRLTKTPPLANQVGAWFGAGYAEAGIAYPSRTLGTFTTSGTGNPNPAWEYYQGIGAAFPSANVTVSVGEYEPYYITGDTFTIANGGGGWTGRTSYPTTIFQTLGIAHDAKFFILGGNGLNGTPGGGTTAATYYMTIALSGWTAGTTMPASGGWGGGRTTNKIYASQSSSFAYTGTGTSAWSSCAVAPGGGSYSMNVGDSFSFATTATYRSSNDAVSWTDAGIAPPLSTGPVVVGPTDNNTPTSIYLFYNTYSTPAGYYFNGTAYIATTNYGTESTPTGSNTGNSQFGNGINGNQITFLFGNGGYRYATINA
jgi:hypothetical protein